MAFGSQQYPRQQYTTWPASDRPLLAWKPVQWATSATPDSRYASVAPSKPVADIVKEYSNFVKPIQTSDQPRSIESISNPVQSQASSTPSTNAFSAFTNQFWGAENIGNMQGINSNVWGIEGTSFNGWDDTTKNAIRDDIPNPLTWTDQQTDTSINLVLADLKADIDWNNTIEDLMWLYPDVPAEILPDLYTDIKNGTSLLEVKSLYPELWQPKSEESVSKYQATWNPFFDFIGKSTDDIKTRFSRIKDDIKDSIKDVARNPLLLQSEVQQSLWRIMWEWAWLVGNDAIQNLVQSIGTPKWVDAFNKWVSNLVEKLNNTEYWKAGIDLLSQWSEAYQSLEQSNPELKQDIDALVNLASILPIGKWTQVVWEWIQGSNIAKQIGKQVDGFIPVKWVSQTIAPDIKQSFDIKLTPKIEEKIQKAIKPTVIEKKWSNIIQKFNNDVVKSIDTVQYYWDKIQLKDVDWNMVNRPVESVKDFWDAIQQSKWFVFEEYNAKKAQAWEAWLEIDLKNAVNELQATKEKLKRIPWQRQVMAYIDEQIDDLNSLWKLNPDEAQTAMQVYNDRLNAFYRNPQPNDVWKASIDALINNSIRDNMNKWIEAATGWPEYQILKDRYRALLNIEKEVMKRAVVSGRQNAKSLLDFSDLFTADQAIGAIVNVASGNIPWAIKNTLSAVFINWLKSMYKKINSPDVNLKELFDIVNKDRWSILIPKKWNAGISISNSLPKNPLWDLGMSKAWLKQNGVVEWPQQLGLPEKSQWYNLGTDKNPIVWKAPIDNTKLTNVTEIWGKTPYKAIDNTPKPKTILDTIVAKKIAERKAKVETSAKIDAPDSIDPKTGKMYNKDWSEYIPWPNSTVKGVKQEVNNDLLQEAKKYKTADEFVENNINETPKSIEAYWNKEYQDLLQKRLDEAKTKDGIQPKTVSAIHAMEKKLGIDFERLFWDKLSKQELRDIRQQANKEPQTPTKPQGEKPKNDVLSRAIDKVKAKKASKWVDEISSIENQIKTKETFIKSLWDTSKKWTYANDEYTRQIGEIWWLKDRLEYLKSKPLAKSEKGTIIDSNSSIKTKDMQDLYTEARKYKSAEEFIEKQKWDYKMSHEAPNRSDNYAKPLNDLTWIYPDDIYSSNWSRYYWDWSSYDQQSISIISWLKWKPNKEVTIYRAIPNDITVKDKISLYEKHKNYIQAKWKLPPWVDNRPNRSEYYNYISEELEKLYKQDTWLSEKVDIRPWDWVSINRSYAVDHWKSNVKWGYKIIQKKVKANELFTDGNSIHEQWYDPIEWWTKSNSELRKIREEAQVDTKKIAKELVEGKKGVVKDTFIEDTWYKKKEIPQKVLDIISDEKWYIEKARIKNASYIYRYWTEKFDTQVIEAYKKEVKNLISKWYDVPKEIINRYPEFLKAVDARARYEKWLYTSFSSKDQRIDMSTKEEIGWWVKRQDGKEITLEQKNEIIKWVKDFGEALWLDITKLATEKWIVYAHLNGKNAFLSKWVWMYREAWENISVSVWWKETAVERIGWKPITEQINTTMQHELWHALDYMKNKRLLWWLTWEAKRKYNPVESMQKYYRSDVEVTARLIEQYVSIKKWLVSYYDKPWYWKKDKFDWYIPEIERAIKEKFPEYLIGNSKTPNPK